MKKDQLKNVRKISLYLEDGIEELGKENNVNIEAKVLFKEKKGKMPDSVFVLQDFADKMCFRDDVTLPTYRVLMFFISLLKYENFLSIDVKSISERLKISEVSVKRATKWLCQQNILIKMEHTTDKRRLDYYVNPLSMWRGSAINRDKHLDKIRKHKDKMQLNLF
jgi:predicted transcriptional regulator